MSLPVFGLLFSLPAFAETSSLPEPKTTGLMQTWVTVMDQDQTTIADPGGYGDPEDDFGFKIRRVRVGLEGKNKTVKYGITVGSSAPFDSVAAAQGSTNELGLVDTYGGYSPTKGLWVVAGVQKAPISREALIASSELALSSRAAISEWLTPGRDIGAMVDYRWKFLRTRIGAFNGGGDLSGDDNAGKLYAGRIEAKIGDGAVYRTFGTVDGTTVGIAVDAFVNHEVAISSQGMGADLIVRFGGLALLGEARTVTSSPNEDLVSVPGVFAETERQGFSAQMGYTIDRFEPVVRYSVFDDDRNMEDTGDVAELQSGVTWHGKGDVVRAGLGYVMRNELGPIKTTNDTVRAWLQLKI